jgi:hypothetical protein
MSHPELTQICDELVSGAMKIADVPDNQLGELCQSWTDEDNQLHPTEHIWGKARDERKWRKVEKERKKVAEALLIRRAITKKKVKTTKDFYG